MSFLVRTVSRTADGREIVRPVSFATDTIVIGRDASNQIHLADLAVEPCHARLTLLPGGRVRAETVGGLGFGVDGSITTRIEIDAARGAELRFGGHRLTLAMDGDVAGVTVERIGALSEASGARDERTAFSLTGLLPGKRAGSWAFAALILLTCLAWPIWSWATHADASERPAGLHADMAWSSGPLSRAHHGLEGDCQACHVKPFVPVEDGACLTCHKTTHDHADPRRQIAAMAPPGVGTQIGNAFKIAFGKPTGQRCVDCHTEHEGAGPMQASRQAFCTDCHATMKVRLADTKLADAADFGTGHPAFRPLRVDGNLKFPHDVHLSRTGGVARMAQTLGWKTNRMVCSDCHTLTADGVRFIPVDMERNCQMCHSLGYDRIGGTVRTLRHGDAAQAVADVRALGWRPPLAPSVLPGRHRPGDALPVLQGSQMLSADALFVKGGACFDCHIVSRTGDASTNGWQIARVVQPMRYFANGWFEHKAHATQSCLSCHAAETSRRASDLLLPVIGSLGDRDGGSCRSCHGGEASHSKVPSSCALCHSYHIGEGAPWRPTGGRRD